MARRSRGFTLIELLTVLVIVALLSAVAFPSFSSARAMAQRTRTRVMFSQWASAIAAFSSEYSCAPAFGAGHLVNDGAATNISGDHLFHDLLAGRHRDGSALDDNSDPLSAVAQNPKRIPFCRFAGADIGADGRLCDASGNVEIAVLVDVDLDGWVTPGVDFDHLPIVHSPDGTALMPAAADFPASGVRAGAVLYAADPSACASNPVLVLSWK
ncbi:MAG TPA: prepilin-type N-terminal cleavage/methylation domain-containing protein [Candidatus Didemnitutus sp.]|jgi:prepilin-type N-terminal cleavage/methylation domain-containing protein